MNGARDVVGGGSKLSALCEERLASAAKALAKLTGSKGARTVESALLPFDRLSLDLDVSGNLCGLLRSVHPEESVRNAAEQGEQKISAFATELSLNREVYDALSAVDPAAGGDPATRHLLKKTLRDFRRSGVDKDEKTRERIKALNEELVRIGQEFDANIRKDVRTVKLDPTQLDGLPEDWKRSHAPGPDGKVSVTTDYPDYIPYITYAKDGPGRKALYLASRNRAVPRNLEVLKSLLVKRYELAKILGYDNWAAYATEDKMIKSVDAAAEFIEKITAASEERMKADYRTLLARKQQDEPGATQVFDWERTYYEDRVQAENYSFDSQAVRPYFEYDRVKNGVFEVTARMFGVRYTKVAASAWHPDVEIWDLSDAATDEPLGRFYLDMHPREGKYKHAAMFPVVSGVEGLQLPEAALVCNFPQAKGGEHALLEHDDVKTFFHEFGHLLHHLLGGRQKWVGTSGIKTEWDFVEAPSQMLEEWVWDLDTLRTFARHIETQAPIPAELVKAMRAASDFGKGLQVRHQMYYAKLSLELYRHDPAGIDTTELSKELMNRYSPFRYVEDTRFEASFGHLDGYSAIYYTYMWSLVIAKDLFSDFKKRGLLDPEVATRYRRAVLAPGGSREADQLVESFLGRPASFSSFESWLNEAGA